MNFLSEILLISIKIIFLIAVLLFLVAYYTYFERKIIGYMQDRIGPNRVGYWGLLQPVADGIKLLFKEIIIPKDVNLILYRLAPVLAFAPALIAWSVVPISENFLIADINLGLLFLLAMTSLSVYGILIAGWASNSRYALMGTLRSAAQTISYEIAMGFCFVGVVMAAQSMNLTKIIQSQNGNLFTWYWLPLFPLMIIYIISAIAETNRSPFDMAEGESEIVAGFQVEYSGIAFAMFFMAEYANMLLVSGLAVIMFFGGYLSPFQNIPILGYLFSFIPGLIWFGIKTGFLAFLLVWVRATFPRYRYDQIMYLGWKIFIPITLIWIVLLAFMIKLNLPPWFSN